MKNVQRMREHAARTQVRPEAERAPDASPSKPKQTRRREPGAVTGARLYQLLGTAVLPANTIAKRLSVPERRVRALCRQLRDHGLLHAIPITIRGLPPVTYYCVLSDHNVEFLAGTGGP